MDRLIIIVPCFNEEEVLPNSTKQLVDVINNLKEKGKIAPNSGILLVNDGSRDKTWELIKKENKKYNCVYGLNLAANVGHQNALFAGIDCTKDICDFSISIDADLQDDILAIEKMVDKYNSGTDIVYGVRSDRKSDSFFKRTTAQGFYKFMSAMGVKTIYNHADFRLMSSRAMKQLCCYKERNLFLRGIVPEIGYKTDTVEYSRKPRTAGKSKYPFKKMLNFAWQGITSFSIKPISVISFLGASIIFFSIIAFIYTLISYFLKHTQPGWSSLMISIWFLGGVQLFAIGMIGQYVGKIYIESKERPRYNIEELLMDDKDKDKDKDKK